MLISTGVARLGKDAELRYTTDNTPVMNLSLAFNYGRRDNNGDRPTQWIEASLWGARAEALADYMKKGQALDVVLEDVHIETFERQGRSEGFKLVARVLAIEFAGPAPDGQGQRGNGGQRQQRPAGGQRGNGQRHGDRPGGAYNRGNQAGGFDDFDDRDIPF